MADIGGPGEGNEVKSPFEAGASGLTSTDIGGAIRELKTLLDASPWYADSRVVLVDPGHSNAADDADLSTPFLTPSAAVTAIGDPSGVYHVVLVAPGVYDDNVVINYNKINLMGFGINTSVIRPSTGDGLTMRPASDSSGPRDTRIVNMTIKNITVSGETAPASGVFYGGMCGNELLFDTSTIEGYLNVDTANYISAQGIYINGTASFTNVAGQWFNFSEVAGALTIDYDSGNQEPNDTGNYGWSPYGGAVGSVTLSNEGKIDARSHFIGGTLTIDDATCEATFRQCFVNAITNTGGITISNTGAYYDNATSGLTATDMQAAIDELKTLVDAASDPDALKKLGSVNVDMLSTGQTLLYTVPTGKKLLAYKVMSRCTASDTPGFSSNGSIGSNAPNYDNLLFGFFTIPTTVDNFASQGDLGSGGIVPALGAGTQIYVNITTGDGGTDLDVQFDLLGYLVDA